MIAISSVATPHLTSPHLTSPLRAQWTIKPKSISSSALCQLLHVWLRSSCSTPVRVFHFQQLIATLSLVDQPLFYLRPSHICCSCPFVGYVCPTHFCFIYSVAKGSFSSGGIVAETDKLCSTGPSRYSVEMVRCNDVPLFECIHTDELTDLAIDVSLFDDFSAYSFMYILLLCTYYFYVHNTFMYTLLLCTYYCYVHITFMCILLLCTYYFYVHITFMYKLLSCTYYFHVHITFMYILLLCTYYFYVHITFM